MANPIAVLRDLGKGERRKAALLSGLFFLVIATLWLLKPIRSASIIGHLGSEEIPFARLVAVVAVAAVVGLYSRYVDRFSRLGVVVGASVLFAAVFVAYWLALILGGEALGRARWFVWSVFAMVDIYSTVMVGIFWTYSNDIVTRAEADKLYGPIGVGGIVGGIAGGALVDVFVGAIGTVNLLLLCAAMSLLGAAVVTASERILKPPPRALRRKEQGGASAALEGLREVAKSRYLLLIVGIVVGYEFAAATTDFVISVVFERAYQSQEELAKMFGRLGWVSSGASLVAQIALVPLLLPKKRLALLVPPVAMALATVGLWAAPIVALAFVLSAADRGLNYSLQQVTKETLYVPLDDAQKYKAKALIDMLADRAAKAASAIALMLIIAAFGVSLRISLFAALVSLALWALCASALGRAYARKILGERGAEPASGPGAPPSGASGPPSSRAGGQMGAGESGESGESGERGERGGRWASSVRLRDRKA